MCEIITICMALIFTGLLFAGKSKKNSPIYSSIKTGMLIFWGAALMWFVDCVVSAMNGEGFFDFSREDTVLGIMIALIGIAVVIISSLISLWISKEIEKRRIKAEQRLAEGK